jgi:hypothetical protein
LRDLTSRESEIFVPSLITRGRRLVVEGVPEGMWKYDEARQTLFVLNPPEMKVDVMKMVVKLDPPLSPRWAVKQRSLIYYTAAFGVVLVAFFYLLLTRL